MTDSLFNAELRDCARINERDLRVAQADWEAEQREASRAEQAYHNAWFGVALIRGGITISDASWIVTACLVSNKFHPLEAIR